MKSAKYQRGFLLNPYRFSSNRFSIPVDENSTFNDEGSSTVGWSSTNSNITTDGDWLRVTKVTGGLSAGGDKSLTFTPANEDYILYGRARASYSSGHISTIWLLNGAKEVSIWFGTTDGGSSGPGVVVGAMSITGTTGASTYNHAQVGSGISYDTTPVEFALHFDYKQSTLTCYFRSSIDGSWSFGGRVDCDFFDTTQIGVWNGSASSGGAWIEIDYLTLCQPNYVAIGDSICEGKTLFSPDPSLVLTNYTSTWMSHALIGSARRNNLIVNKGVGGNTSAQILARINDAIDCSPRICFLHASTNDVVGGISQSTRTSNIQSTIDAIVSTGAEPVLLNAVYGTSTSPDNTPTPDLQTYMASWWATSSATLTDVKCKIDIMNPIMDSGFMDATKTQADGVHPTIQGYTDIGQYIKTYEKG